jgi:2-C-methyl-D-erythritol 4-phosphate cytidylyltransferase
MTAVALLVAAGRGERLGSDGPKALVMLGGHPMIEHSMRALRAVPEIDHVVCALPPGITAPAGAHGVQGGEHRSLSVKNALRHAGEHADVIVVHDAARPLVTPEIFRACLDELAGCDCDAVIAAAPVADTLKEAGSDGVVTRTVDRARLWAVQTPQAFRRDALERALDADPGTLAGATDDAALVEAAGGEVRVVAAPRENFKVTTPEDLRLAELVLRGRVRGGTAPH